MNPAEHEHDETCDDHNLSLLSTISIWSSLFGMIVIITVTLYYRKIFIYLYTHLISLSLLLHLQGVQQKFNKTWTGGPAHFTTSSSASRLIRLSHLSPITITIVVMITMMPMILMILMMLMITTLVTDHEDQVITMNLKPMSESQFFTAKMTTVKHLKTYR